ncbi:MAG: NTP transferase domain-containing protein [Candidatus Nanopelagicales bacterium]|nr:NTP transferase domain-containing protein [Candidatus Nanopelagicales bacterium]MDZ4250675.1 NTP transferase domain-containing protein [Candidatus Nanopelagicales bacterium]
MSERDIGNWTAIILTGGGSTRLGQDKSAATVWGRSLLDHVLASLPPEVPVVVVGPAPKQPVRDVAVTRENPPGGGPVAAIAAGLELVTHDVVAVIATDMPFSGGFVSQLAQDLACRIERDSAASGNEQGTPDALIPADAAGRSQPLCAAYRRNALRAAIRALGDPAGQSVRAVLSSITTASVPPPDGTELLMDVDSPADLATARDSSPAIVYREGHDDLSPITLGVDAMLSDWIAAVQSELGLDADVNLDAILDVAKDTAHGVTRPAAPVTTYLLGCAVAAGADVQEAAASIRALATQWQAEE